MNYSLVDTYSLHNSAALIENNDGFPRLLTPRELSQAVVSNVLQRRPQSSRVCARICPPLSTLCPQLAHLSST